MRRALLALTLAIAPLTARAESPPPPSVRTIDLLIVVDTSPGAAPLRARLTAALPSFVDALEQDLASTTFTGIDLRVGVITADPADAGKLRTAVAADCAAAPDDAWVAYTAAPGGYELHANFHAGTVADAIACLIPGPNATGADDAQPLANLARAIDPTAGTGFVRAGATHAFLVASTREDCSTAGAPLARFACLQDAWSCTPALDATAGARTCTVQYQPLALTPPTALLDALETIDASPDLVAFGALRGPPSPISVTAGPDVAPTCAANGVAATPALRLDAIESGLAHGWLGDACAVDLASFADVIVAAVWTPVGSDDYHGDCDGGIPVDPVDQHPLTGCVGCASGAPSGGTALAFAIAALVAFRRSSPSRRCRARRARAAG